MPSIRSILTGGKPASDPAAQQHGLEGEGVNAPGGPDTSKEPTPEPSEAELIAERLRFGADQRVAFAESEISRLQVQKDLLNDRIQELTKQNLPTGELRANLDHVEHRLEEVKEDLARAQESRRNTDYTASAGLARRESTGQQQHIGHGKPTVGDSIGKHSAQPNIAHGPRKKL